MRDRVRSDPNFSNSEVEEVDIAVAMLVIKEAYNNDRTDNLLLRVEEVLSQSDRALEWKRSMSQNEYKAVVKDYIVQKYEQASYLRENIRTEREKNQEIEFER